MFGSLIALAAVLPASIIASPNSFPSPSDGFSCARSIGQVSCHSSSTIDPNSYGTCCYNGALVPGNKESGLVLATQFWNLTTGPSNSFTIHGLWPDYCDGSYPQFCTTQSGIPEKSGDQIEALLQQYDPSLLAYMRTYYENDPSFWEHEYNKHGTCFSTLRAKCQLDLSPFLNQTSAAVVGYFQQIVHEFKQLPSYDWLAQAGITPDSTKTYKLTDIQNALAKKQGGLPYIGCYKGTLSEVWYYYNVRGPLIHGQYLPVNTTSKSSCPADVLYRKYFVAIMIHFAAEC
jgi:ribonuclease T2